LFNGETLLYIGQSTDIMKRIQQHMQDKKFDNYSYKMVNEINLKAVERACIKQYNPIMNTTHSNKKLSSCTVDIDILEGTAKLVNSTIYAKIDNEIVYSRVDFHKNKYGRSTFELRDLIGEISYNGGVLIKNFDFKIKVKNKWYGFISNRDNTYSLSSD
jgi:predicted GIY-YIG superfamily endonuclease